MSSTDRVVFKDGRDGGSGSFLCPPGHPNLKYSVYVYEGHRREPNMITSVEGAATDEYLPESARRRAQKMLDDADLVCSEMWVRNVYGYFRHMYVPVDGSRKATDLIDVTRVPADEREHFTPERHAAVATVREYFPDHEPRVDLIKDSSYCYGAYACTKCGTSVQYEPKFDALAEFGRGPDCPKGGQHEWPERKSDA